MANADAGTDDFKKFREKNLIVICIFKIYWEDYIYLMKKSRV